MNSLMTRKKKYRFKVELRVEELQHVPFVNQELYVKVRLLEGGFTNHSQSLMVRNHAVRWDEAFKFSSKMTASASTGELDTCICRVSVRQEVRGGRSFQKLGYADVNLAQFAGCGGSQRYLLEAYNSRHRLHNSTLRVTVEMVLSSGDICFKAQPVPRPIHTPASEGGSTEESDSRSKGPASGPGSVASLGYSSLEKKFNAEEKETLEESELTGHSRNSSNTSGSGYASNASHSDKSGGHVRSGSQGSGGVYSEEGSLERPVSSTGLKPSHSDTNKDPRVLSTREDPQDMINQIFQDTLGTSKTDETSESVGLRLYINQDGTASVSGHTPPSTGDFKPVILTKR